MSTEAPNHWHCDFCTAYFPTKDLLQRHFEEYRTRAAELERCKAHADAGRTCDSDEGFNSENDSLAIIRTNTRCPFRGCGRETPFKKGQQLRVHFRTHVECEEVCVCCFKVFRVASEYIRHSRQHYETTPMKRNYINQMCEMLGKRSDDELNAALAMVPETLQKKRTWGAAFDVDTLVAMERTNRLQKGSDEIRESEDAVSTLTQQETGLIATTAESVDSLLPETKSIDVGNFAAVTNESYSTAPEDQYDAPLFMRLNFPIYPASMDGPMWFADGTSDVLQQ